MRRLVLMIAMAACAFASAPEAPGQTGTHVSGTFKTAEGKTPTQAGLNVVATIGATAVYGTVDFLPVDPATKRATRLRCGGITYAPQPVRMWIRGDGAIVDASAALGTDLKATAGCEPSSAVYRATVNLAGTADGRIRAMTWTEEKAVPNQANVDWGAI